MNKDLTLVIMAAGMGSRYGGLKQLDSFGPSGEIIIDYSIYDAKRAGINKVVFIIKEENLELFKEKVGDKIAKHMEVEYAFQGLDMLPKGYSVPEGRVKPWGTSHALLCAKDKITTPFIVINADDYYGRETFEVMVKAFGSLKENSSCKEGLLAGFSLDQTVSENGTVSRGVCRVQGDYVVGIDERKTVRTINGKIEYTLDNENWIELDRKSFTSVNFFGFTQDFLTILEERFPKFLDENIENTTAEYAITVTMTDAIEAGELKVKIVDTPSRWFGVTYPQDKDIVMTKINDMIEKGEYPYNLWG